MRYYTCFYRHRDNTGKIIGYTLRSEDSFEWMQVTPQQIKYAIVNNRVCITNLKLTSDNRLIETPNNKISEPKPGVNYRDIQGLVSVSKVQVKDDNENLGYMDNQIRENQLKDRVKFDGVFEINKLSHLLFGRRAGKTRKHSQDNSSSEDGTDYANAQSENS